MYYGVINEEGLYKRWICKDILRVTTKYVQRLVIFWRGETVNPFVLYNHDLG